MNIQNNISSDCMRRLVFFILFFSYAIVSLGQSNQIQHRELPDNFPTPEILLSDEPAPGYFFLSPAGLWDYFPDATPYLAIIDNYGTPIFFAEQTSAAFDFKLQNDSTITYAFGTLGRNHHVLNNKFEFVEDLIVHGFPNDFHDIVILDNGNYLMLANEYRIVDMDTVVEGGQQGVTVIGGVVQIQNRDDEVLFHWSTFDHFKITDAADHVDLTNSNSIDYAHINSIEMDSDSTIVISSRNMHEITKINTLTGEMIWRMGGENNMFNFNSDTSMFSGQHDFRKLADGHYSVFDNNWFSGGEESRALVYSLDEANKNAALVSQYKSYPISIYGSIMGNAQLLDNGHWVVGWGSGDPNVTEFKPDGSKALEMRYDAVSYRAFKFNWKPEAFTFNVEEGDFGDVSISQPTIMTFELNNNLQYDIEINSINQHDDKFIVNTALPVFIPAQGNAIIEIQFNPTGVEGIFEDLMTFSWDTLAEGLNYRIAAQLPLLANASTNVGIVEEFFQQVHIFPNPFSERICVDLETIPKTRIKIRISSIYGRVVYEADISNKNRFEISTKNFHRGVYQIQIFSAESKYVQKLIKL